MADRDDSAASAAHDEAGARGREEELTESASSAGEEGDADTPLRRFEPYLDIGSYPLPPIGDDPRDIGSKVPAEIQRTYPVEPDRVIAFIFAAVLVLVGVTRADILPAAVVPGLQVGLDLGLWAFAGLYGIAAVAWVWYTAKGVWTDYPAMEYGPDDIQVRILTIDAESVVQRTVDTLPDEFADRHVIAEADIEIDDAIVHVVPEDFECTAAAKGRALEWARQNLACDKEYVLFLDEDSLVNEFEGLPDADVVQFRERPYRPEGGSWLVYWAEVLRMGYQLEQVGYAVSDIPLYSWGGGLAVRKAVEDEVTWDFETLIEDTVFTWFAVSNGASFEVVETKFQNQAPPSLREMFNQRRRWFAGTIRDEEYLSVGYQLLLTVRNVVWAYSPIVVAVTVIVFVTPGETFRYVGMPVLLVILLGLTSLWVVGGIRYYDGPDRKTLPLVFLVPIVIALHSFGALLGLLVPPQTFQTTEKESHEQSTES